MSLGSQRDVNEGRKSESNSGDVEKGCQGGGGGGERERGGAGGGAGGGGDEEETLFCRDAMPLQVERKT